MKPYAHTPASQSAAHAARRQASCSAAQAPAGLASTGSTTTPSQGLKIADCLKGVDLFTALGQAEIARLACFARQKPCGKGETVVTQFDPAGEHLYVVAEGEAAVIVEGHDGKESIVALLKQGDFFGEMSLFDGSPRAASVRTTAASRLIVLRGEDILRGLREWPGFALTLLGEMMRRLRQSNAKVAGLAHQRVERRVALVLLQLFEERGVRLKDEGGRRCIILRGRPTQQQLAEMAGTSRETVSRVVSDWEKKGIVRDHVRDLFLLDEAALRKV